MSKIEKEGPIFNSTRQVNPVPRIYVRGFGELPFGMFGTFTPCQPRWTATPSFPRGGVGTGFIPALTYGAFCGTG
jgi:hypothetical protein